MGTMDYVAPEQIRGDAVDGRADVYALGCLLYETLTGELPYRRSSDVATIFAHLEEEPAPASRHAPELPGRSTPSSHGRWRRDREERYDTCSELIADARTALGVRRRLAWRVAADDRCRRARRSPRARRRRGRGRPHAGILGPRASGRLAACGSMRRRVRSSTASASQRARRTSPPTAPVRCWYAADGELWRLDPRGGEPTRIETVGAVHGIARPRRQGLRRAGGQADLRRGRRPVRDERHPRRRGCIVRLQPDRGREDRALGGELLRREADRRLDRSAEGREGHPDPDHAAADLGDDPVVPLRHDHRRRCALGARRRGRSAHVAARATGAPGRDDRRRERAAQHRRDTGSDLGHRPARRTSSCRWTRGRTASSGRSPSAGVPAGVVAGADAVWVANELDGTVSRIDPGTGRVTDEIDVGGRPGEVGVGDGSVWVGVDERT